METSLSIEVNIPWSEHEKAVHDGAAAGIKAVAFEVSAEMADNIRGPVAEHWRRRKVRGKWVKEMVTDLIDTGALINSRYVVTGDGISERAQAIMAATISQPGVDIGIENPGPRGDLEAQANVAVNYGAAVEALYPFADPAAETVKKRAQAIVDAEIAKALK